MRASARPSPPVCASGVRFDELRIVKTDVVVSVQNGSQSRVRIAIRSLSCGCDAYDVARRRVGVDARADRCE